MDVNNMEVDRDVEDQQNGATTEPEYNHPNYPVLPPVDLDDWQYVMRRTMQEIIPGLFLGPYAAASKAKLDDMKSAGLTHVVCVRELRERNLIRPNHPNDFKYLVVEVEDSTISNIIPHFKTVNPFITEALAKGGKVLVHGSAGISRSVALVIAFIMETYGVTTLEAYKYVQSIRFCSNPNEGFMAQLREYEPIYRAMHVVPIPLPNTSPTQRVSKRALEEDDDFDDGKKGFFYIYHLNAGNDSVITVLEKKKTSFLAAINLRFNGQVSPEQCKFLCNVGLRPKKHPHLEILQMMT